MIDAAAVFKLSQREITIIELIAAGLSAKEIAQRIGIAPRTVERHAENARMKSGARNRAHMVAKAMTTGILRGGHERPSSQRSFQF